MQSARRSRTRVHHFLSFEHINLRDCTYKANSVRCNLPDNNGASRTAVGNCTARGKPPLCTGWVHAKDSEGWVAIEKDSEEGWALGGAREEVRFFLRSN